MRESLRKVKEVCFPVIDDQKWLSNIDNTQVCYLDFSQATITSYMNVNFYFPNRIVLFIVVEPFTSSIERNRKNC